MGKRGRERDTTRTCDVLGWKVAKTLCVWTQETGNRSQTRTHTHQPKSKKQAYVLWMGSGTAWYNPNAFPPPRRWPTRAHPNDKRGAVGHPSAWAGAFELRGTCQKQNKHTNQRWGDGRRGAGTRVLLLTRACARRTRPGKDWLVSGLSRHEIGTRSVTTGLVRSGGGEGAAGEREYTRG